MGREVPEAEGLGGPMSMHPDSIVKSLTKMRDALIAEVREAAKTRTVPGDKVGWWAWCAEKDKDLNALEGAIKIVSGR
jgi:hypothetical protein